MFGTLLGNSGLRSPSSPPTALGDEHSVGEGHGGQSEALRSELEKLGNWRLSALTGVSKTGTETRKWVLKAQRGLRFS